jgi:hypothetical protein
MIGYKHRTARIKEPGKNRMEKTARKGKVCNAARTGQQERGSPNETFRTRLPGQNYQNRTASTGLLSQSN